MNINIVVWQSLMFLTVFIHNIPAVSRDQDYKSGMNYSQLLTSRITERIVNMDINQLCITTT